MQHIEYDVFSGGLQDRMQIAFHFFPHLFFLVSGLRA